MEELNPGSTERKAVQQKASQKGTPEAWWPKAKMGEELGRFTSWTWMLVGFFNMSSLHVPKAAWGGGQLS